MSRQVRQQPIKSTSMHSSQLQSLSEYLVTYRIERSAQSTVLNVTLSASAAVYASDSTFSMAASTDWQHL